MGRQEAERGWWSRNWGWCVGCGCLIPVLAIGGIAYGTFWLGDRLFENNGALETAVARVNEDPRAVALLGSPIEPKLLRNTNISFSGKQKMQARFGVEGPDGHGRLRVEAHYSDDEKEWLLDSLLLDVDGHDATINLLEETPPGEVPAAEEDLTDAA